RGFKQLDRDLYNLFDFLINRVGFIFLDTFINILRPSVGVVSKTYTHQDCEKNNTGPHDFPDTPKS
ncbi:hypothetical protein BpHYR1_010673, partial [Brachionus plicatilis]